MYRDFHKIIDYNKIYLIYILHNYIKLTPVLSKFQRSRSFDRVSVRDRDYSPVPSSSRSKSRRHSDKPNVSEVDLEGKSPDEQEIMRTMGFCGFDSTKNKKVDGNQVGEVHVILKRKYRQYMNRKGGFNRPLDFVA